MAYQGKGIVKATGLENPAKSEHVEIGIKHSITRPVAAAAGSFSRKIPGPEVVGQDVAGEADETSARGGSKDVGKQTWKGARSGYTTVKAPALAEPAPASCTYQDDPKYGVNQNKGPSGHSYKTERPTFEITKGGGSPAQSVKGKDNPKRRAEAKQVAGDSRSPRDKS